MNTAQIYDAMRARYCAPEWAILFEVGNATGFAANRHADAIAMSLWPSRGLALHGFEFKASRSDWTKELKDPAKADAIAKYCDYWHLVVGDRDIVKPGELPKSWGLLAPKGDKLVQVTEAEKLAPSPVDRGFLAAMFRCIHSEVDAPVKQIADKARAEGFVSGRESAGASQKHELECARNKHAELLEAVTEFERLSGVRITAYSGPYLGTDFRNSFGHSFGHKNNKSELQEAVSQIKKAADLIRHAMKSEELCDYFL